MHIMKARVRVQEASYSQTRNREEPDKGPRPTDSLHPDQEDWGEEQQEGQDKGSGSQVVDRLRNRAQE